MFYAIADAKHHRRGGTQADAMHRAHYREPLVSRTLRRDALAYFIVETLRAATGQTVKPRSLQTRHDRFVVELRDQVQVVNLGFQRFRAGVMANGGKRGRS